MTVIHELIRVSLKLYNCMVAKWIEQFTANKSDFKLYVLHSTEGLECGIPYTNLICSQSIRLMAVIDNGFEIVLESDV